MAEFNLRRLVREVRSNSTMRDPHLIAAEVLRRIGDSDLRPALAECLASFVREEIRHSRNHGSFPPIAPASPSPLRPMQSASPTPQVLAGPLAKRPGYSSKVAAIRAAAHTWMEEEIHVSADPRDWKRIGDCGFTELMFAVESRREMAQRTNAKADQYEALAQLVHTCGVKRVRDLPVDVLRGVGGMAA